MRRALIGAAVLVGAGVVLTIVGATWYRAFNTEYSLTVEEVLAGEPSGWLTLGPRRKRAVVSGFAVRSKAEPITVQSRSKAGQTSAERIYLPLRVPDDHRAILVSLPRDRFDDRVLLTDNPDEHRVYTGVIDLTPRTKDGGKVEQLFEGVTFPSPYCLTVGATGGWREPKWLAVSGVALILAGAALAALKRPRRAPASAQAVVGVVAGVTGEQPANEGPGFAAPETPSAASHAKLADGEPKAIDAMAAMSAVVSGQPSADEQAPAPDHRPEDHRASDDEPGDPGFGKDNDSNEQPER